MTQFSMMPDGYQVIDVTTGEAMFYDNDNILTWQVACRVKERYQGDEYEIIAVTEDRVKAELDSVLSTSVCYIPGGFTISAGIKDATKGPFYTTGDPDHEYLDDHLFVNPAELSRILITLGLARASKPEYEQQTWSFDDVVALTKAYEPSANDHPSFAGEFEKFKAFIKHVAQYDGDLLILDYNGVDVWSLDQHPKVILSGPK